MTRDFSRRTALRFGGVAVLAAAATALPSGAYAQAIPAPRGSRGLAKGFANPGIDARAWFRYWIPDATVSPASIRADVDAMADGGFGGVEITNLPQFGVTIDDDTAWGSPAWEAILQAALSQAHARGMHASMLISPAWPAAVPTITTSSPAASKQLSAAHEVVHGAAGYTGAVPAPSGMTDPVLVAVQAFRSTTTTIPTSGTTILDPSTYTDLTGRVTLADGNPQIRWTAPAGDPWLLIGFWQNATGQSNESGRVVVVDHYSTVGSAAVTGYWDSAILTAPIARLVRSVPTSIFEDSIELSAGTHWTPTMPAEFKSRRGYSLLPYLPATIAGAAAGFGQTAVAPYTFPGDVATRVLQDFNQTLSDLYLSKHTWVIQDWAHRRGMKYKAQDYGGQIDTSLATATIDFPEGESLDDGVHTEKWRVIAGGAHLGGRNIVSCEADATLNNAYGSTWAGDMLPMSNGNFASGVNRDIIHGYPTYQGPQAVWPGNDAFLGTTIGDNWGPRNPTWQHITDMSGYLARCQYVLQQGTPRVDLAVYRPGLDIGYGSAASGIGMWTDPALAAAGYTYDYQSAGSLQTRNAVVRGGVLAPDGPRYRALILFNQTTLSLDIASNLLDYSARGLPIFITGSVPSTTPGYRDAAREDAELARLVASLLKRRNVFRIADESSVPAALAAHGILPAARYAAPTADLAGARRTLRGTDLYFFTNVGTDPITTGVTLAGDGTPYRLDPFSGAVTPIAEHQRGRGTVTTDITVAAGDSVILAVGDADAVGGDRLAAFATGSTADVVYEKRALAVRAFSGGSYRTTLSTGRSVTTAVPALPAVQNLTRWHLSVQEWKPGATATTTDKSTVVNLDLTALVPWDQIAGLGDASGIGTYTTTFPAPTVNGKVTGAVLSLGAVTDTFRVWLNGTQLPPQDIITATIDLGPYLRGGSNSLKIEVATTLRNVLRITRGGQWADLPRQDYGLIGPVTVTPYLDVPVH